MRGLVGRIWLVGVLAIFPLSFVSMPPAVAAEYSIDALAPGNVGNCASPIGSAYGNTIVAGSNATLSKIEFVVNSSVAIPANYLQAKVSTVKPMSMGGTLVETYVQSSVAADAADGSNYYYVSFTGSSSLVSGTTYYIQVSYVSAVGSMGLCISSNSYSTLNGWDFKKSASQYVLFSSASYFNFSSYHKFRLTTGALETTVAFNDFYLTGNVKTSTYSTKIALTANVTTPSRVTFYADNKRIAKCISLPTSGSSPNIVATCNWSPSKRGFVNLYAKATPLNLSLSSNSSSILKVSVQNRSSTR